MFFFSEKIDSSRNIFDLNKKISPCFKRKQEKFCEKKMWIHRFGNLENMSQHMLLIWVVTCKLLLIWSGSNLELVSKELNHFGVIADSFRQIGGHSSRFVLFCSFWRLFTMKMIKSVKVFPFPVWKIITKKKSFYFLKFKPPA